MAERWRVLTLTRMADGTLKQDTRPPVPYVVAMGVRDQMNKRGREIVAVVRDRDF